MLYSQLICSIDDQAHQKGYAVLLGNTRRGEPGREREYVRRVETRLADGIIQLRPYSPEQGNAIPDDVACVSAAGCEASYGPAVRSDNRGAAKPIVDYLNSPRHRRIGGMSGLTDNPHAI